MIFLHQNPNLNVSATVNNNYLEENKLSVKFYNYHLDEYGYDTWSYGFSNYGTLIFNNNELISSESVSRQVELYVNDIQLSSLNINNSTAQDILLQEKKWDGKAQMTILISLLNQRICLLVLKNISISKYETSN